MTTTLRTVTKDTGNREVEIPVDSLGREKWRAKIDTREIKTGADGSIGFRGHAAMFNRRSWIGPKRWGFWEQVAPGAFTKSINDGDVRMLINHNPDLLLARTQSNTLRLSEDSQGLVTDADMAPVSYAQDLAVLLDRGDLNQMSFAFEVIRETWEVMGDETELRTLEEVKLWDVSPVTYPAYEDTDAGLRSIAFEVLCRSAGISESDRARFLQSVANGGESDEGLKLLRSAGIATGDLNTEPGSSTREYDQPGSSTGHPLLDEDEALRAWASRTGLKLAS